MNRVDRFWFIRYDSFDFNASCNVFKYYEQIDTVAGRVVWSDSFDKARTFATKHEAMRALDLVRNLSRGDVHLVSLAKVVVKR